MHGRMDPYKGAATRLVGTCLSNPLHHLPGTTTLLVVRYIYLSKLWLLGNYSKVPTNVHAYHSNNILIGKYLDMRGWWCKWDGAVDEQSTIYTCIYSCTLEQPLIVTTPTFSDDLEGSLFCQSPLVDKVPLEYVRLGLSILVIYIFNGESL